MSQIEQFNKLVQDAQRDDDYINATKWCKHFGYRLNNWKQLPETKARLAALSEELKISDSVSREVDYTSDTNCLKISQLVSKELDYTSDTNCLKISQLVSKELDYTSDTNCLKISQLVSKELIYTSDTNCLKISQLVSKELIYTIGRGCKAVTWIHPIMAVHLASCLDPVFANYVSKVFVRYITGDPTLAADIASRQNTVEGLDIINEAVQKQYSLIFGRDWICETSKIKLDFLKEPKWRDGFSESNLLSFLNNKLGLPYKGLVMVFPCSADAFELLEDFLKEKYPNIYQSAYMILEGEGLSKPSLCSMSEGSETALFSYFICEINDWVRDKGGTDCSLLR